MDGCPACLALVAEAGSNAAFYSRKLPIRGWAGKRSQVERAWLRAHPPIWLDAAIARGAPGTVKVSCQDASGPEVAQMEVA